MKVRSQLHMRSASQSHTMSRVENSACTNSVADTRTVAIIGCGNFAFSTIAYYLKNAEPSFLRATCDIEPSRARSLCRAYNGAYSTTNVEDLLQDPMIKLVFISSNHATHATYASACLAAGKSVHIEKPHAVTHEQLTLLAETIQHHPHQQVFLGYNRPRSSHHRTIVELAAQETGPYMIDWFIAGHKIPDNHWYFAEAEGGRVLGNLCHWLDSSLQTIGQTGFFPCTLIPSSRPTSKSEYSITIDCADGSLVSLSFSAKGHTFEGVREVMSLHRGGTLVLLRDFEETRLQKGSTHRVHRTLFRDHGHQANILNSYNGAIGITASSGEPLSYVMNSGRLSLAARTALETGVQVTLEAWQP